MLGAKESFRMSPELRTLRDSLPSSYHFASSVDHPVILEGPDVLIGGEGLLISIYHSRRRSPSNLRARIAVSKLALPSHCLHVLVVETQSMDHSQAQDNLKSFDRMIEISDLTRPSLMREKPSERVTYELGKIKKQQNLFYSRTFQFATARRKHQKDDGSSSRLARLLHERRNNKNVILNYKGIDLSAEDRPTTLPYVKYLCQHRFSEFEFDNNVPYPKQFTPGIAVSDAIPELKGDPEKPLRAAAFSGWIFTDASSIQDLDAIIDRAERFGFGKP